MSRLPKADLSGNFEDPDSVQSIVTHILEEADTNLGLVNTYRIDLGLPFKVMVEEDDLKFTLSAIAQNGELIGSIHSSHRCIDQSHRELKIVKSVADYTKGKIAHVLLGLLNEFEAPLEFEHLRGYDLIIFYIREGYLPVARDKNWKNLETELLDYMWYKPLLRTTDREKMPLTKMQFNPEAAAKYWKRLTELANK